MNKNEISSAVTSLVQGGVAWIVDVLESGSPRADKLRGLLRESAKLLANVADQKPDTISEPTTPAERKEPESEATKTVGEAHHTAAELIKKLKFGAPVTKQVQRARRSENEASDDDLALIDKRCRLKAEGARWAAERRRRRISLGTEFRRDIAPSDRQLIEQAKELSDCYLWMNRPDSPNPENLGTWDTLAGCFDTAADVVALLQLLETSGTTDKRLFKQALVLAAEAQSALRRAVDLVGGPVDLDQQRIYDWIRSHADDRRLYIERFMRLDDPADPSTWKDVVARITALRSLLDQQLRSRQRRKNLFGKLRYATAQVATGEAQGHERQWATIIQTVRDLAADGLPPSNREIRQLLLPVLEQIPDRDDLPAEVSAVLGEIQRFIDSRTDGCDTDVEAKPTLAVQEVRKLLQGKKVVMIGGDSKPDRQEALESAFGLKELIWVETNKHDSVNDFKPYVARPGVAVVLLLIRWASHSYARVQKSCNRHNKPLVRLPQGYGPNQVAEQIMRQCSDRL